MGDLEGELATHRHTARRSVRFRSIELRLDGPSGWKGGSCRLLRADGSFEDIACEVLSGLWADGIFSVAVMNAGEVVREDLAATAILTDFPDGADCFVFKRLPNGLWDGVTIASSHRRLAIVDYACDPS